MAVIIPSSSRLRRLVLIATVALAAFFFLRTPSQKYAEYIGYKQQGSTPGPFIPAAGLEDIEQQQHEPESSQTHLPAPEPNHPPGRGSTPRERLPQGMQEILAWDPPKNVENHYPPYEEYGNRDYDPNRWEAFDQNTDFFLNGTTNRLSSSERRPRFYLPYPEYNKVSWTSRWIGRYESCEGPRGKTLNVSRPDLVTCRRNEGSGFPPPDVGSFEAIGIDQTACFDRYSKLSPYGLPPEQHVDDWQVEWQNVRWGGLQNACLQRNADRYLHNTPTNIQTGILSSSEASEYQDPVEQQSSAETTRKSRSAVLIRAWGDYAYHDNDVQTIRSLVTELSLLSGGEYQVFLFVNIKDESIPIFDDPAEYQETLERVVPDEFRDMAILWNENIGRVWYPEVETHEVYWSQFMPVQWFSKLHPEFDYIWNWEMDVRHIGHTYHFLEKLVEFARKQPRKHLWERNARFYFPAYHGSWAEFVNDTNTVSAASSHVQTVWGPQPWSDAQRPIGPTPPSSEDEDSYVWGVGEEADFISLLPIWNPIDTDWSYRDKVFRYPDLPAEQRRKPFAHIPRRTYINTMVRMSKKLLHTMHLENLAGFSMASEMWPSSVALQHGLKAVYAPHPIWFSHKWPTSYLEAVFNADGWSSGSKGTLDDGHGIAWDADKASRGEPQTGSGPTKEGAIGRWSAQRDAVYSPDREHNFGCFSWYFWSDFPRVIYSRWLGWKSRLPSDALGDIGDHLWESVHGRLCLPSMLLHPVKNVVSSTGDLGSAQEPDPPTRPVVFQDEVFKPGAGRVDTNKYYADFNSPKAEQDEPQ